MTHTNLYTGACLCGAVHFRARDVTDIWYCHCTQCRKITGFYMAAAATARENLEIEGDITWYPISKNTRSGRCTKCASHLFWDMDTRPVIGIVAGCLDDASSIEVKGHIYVDQKPGYYDICDGLPQYEGYPPDGTR